jgi:hypothetical protein
MSQLLQLVKQIKADTHLPKFSLRLQYNHIGNAQLNWLILHRCRSHRRTLHRQRLHRRWVYTPTAYAT